MIKQDSEWLRNEVAIGINYNCRQVSIIDVLHQVLLFLFLSIGLPYGLITEKSPYLLLFLYFILLIYPSIFIIIFTEAIAVDNNAIYALYSVFGKILYIKKCIPFKEIGLIKATKSVFVEVYPKDDLLKTHRNIILISKYIAKREELLKILLSNIDASVVDNTVFNLLRISNKTVHHDQDACE